VASSDSLTPGPPPAPEPEPWSELDFQPIVAFLRNQIGITLEPHRMGLLQARLRSRLQQRAYPSFARFWERVLKVDPMGPGMQLLIDLSTVNHTAFFREAAHFTFMSERLAPLFKDPSGGPIRIWSAGCSTGQEPYSMAMVLAETIPNLSPQKLEIWSTDLSLEVVKSAARAMYIQRDVAGVSPARLRRFFLRGKGQRDGTFRIVPELRDLMKFRHLDLRNPVWPLPTDFHVILCRNVSIYFAEDERMDLLNRLASYLRVGGWLAMGNGEILPGVPNSLRKIAPSIYRKETSTS
jgi:chemotaxis protein methyltransferase CheR